MWREPKNLDVVVGSIRGAMVSRGCDDFLVNLHSTHYSKGLRQHGLLTVRRELERVSNPVPMTFVGTFLALLGIFLSVPRSGLRAYPGMETDFEHLCHPHCAAHPPTHRLRRGWHCPATQTASASSVNNVLRILGHFQNPAAFLRWDADMEAFASSLRGLMMRSGFNAYLRPWCPKNLDAGVPMPCCHWR